MRRWSVVTFLGMAFGAGLSASLATSPGAGATPVDDDWPYPISPIFGLYGTPNAAPTNVVDSGLVTTQDQTWDLYGDPADGTYATHMDIFGIPSADVSYFLSSIHQEVFESSGAVPSVGTTIDTFDMLGSPLTQYLITNYYLNDPEAGSAAMFGMFGFYNEFISDSAGFQWAVQFANEAPVVLFDTSWFDPSSAAALF